jgi:secreted trypsin-like serine protease
MKKNTIILISSFLLSFSSIISAEPTFKPRVLGGTTASQNAYPFMVAIHQNYQNIEEGQFICGGTLINKDWVLTASHCVSSLFVSEGENNPPLGVSPSSIKVSFGSNIINGIRQTRKVAEIILSTSGYTFENDIALLRLNKSISLTPLPYATSSDFAKIAELESARVIGWGATNPDVNKINIGVNPSALQQADIDLYSKNDCLLKLGTNFVPSKSLCAATLASDSEGTGAKDACYGDSGGPLLVTIDGVQKIAGIVSSGYACGSNKYPGIYTDVAAYESFIESTLNPNKRIQTISKVLLDNFPISLERRDSFNSGTDGFASEEEIFNAYLRNLKRIRAKVVVESFTNSLIATIKFERSKLLPKYRKYSTSELTKLRRELIFSMNLAFNNRLLPAKRASALKKFKAIFKQYQ